MLARTVRGDYPPGLSPGICRDRALSILRFLLPTHGAGGVPCADGKPWRNQWQSALWAERAGEAAWLLWDDLDPPLRWLAARMITDEADRFVGVTPPAQVRNDTKAEENAWNATVISLAANMFPHHPRAALWRRTAAIWTVSSYVRAADLERNPLIDGFRLRDVVAGPVIHDDFTLENHSRVHPDYLNCINSGRFQRFVFQWGGQPPPESIDFNIGSLWSTMKTLSLPDGSFTYANGQDWQIRRTPWWVDTHAGQAVWANDRNAALLMRLCLEATERMAARTPDGPLFLPDEYFFPSTQHYVVDMLGDFYLLLRGWGEGPEPAAEEELWRELSGRHVFETGQFALVRTPRSVSTFSWGAQVMGMALPLSKDLLLNPNERSMIGMIAMEGVGRETPRVRRTAIAPLAEGFGISGILDRAGGRVEQRFAFLALPDGRTVYVDSVRTTEPEDLRALDLGTLGILNEPHWVYHDGTRTVHHEGGELTFTAAGEDHPEPVVFSSPWCNIDDMLGVILPGPARRQVYHPNHRPARGRVEQLFHLNSIDLTRLASQGAPSPLRAGNSDTDRQEQAMQREPIARTILVFHPSQTRDATRAAAARTVLETGASSGDSGADSDAGILRLEDGTRVSWDLTELRITAHPAP